MRITRPRILLLAAALAAVGAIALAFCFDPNFSRELQQRLLEPGSGNALWYAGIFAACNVLLLPGSFVTFAAGALFGAYAGFLVVLLGNVVGAAIAFALGRTVARPIASSLVFRSRTVDSLRPMIQRHSWKMILLSQLHPLFPTSLLVYCYALTDVSFWHCMLLVALGRAPGLLLYSAAGAFGSRGLDAMSGRLVHSYSWSTGLSVLAGLVLLLGGIKRIWDQRQISQ